MQGIGEILKKTRESKGITLEEVAGATKIRRKYSEAIEQEEFQLLPGAIYVKGFVTTYLKYLGIKDKPEVVAIMQAKPKEEDVPAHVEDEQEKEKKSQASRRATQQKHYSNSRKKMPSASFEEKPLSKKGSLIIILSVLAVVLLLGLQWVYTHSVEEQPQNNVQQQQDGQKDDQQQNADQQPEDGTASDAENDPAADSQEPVTPQEPVEPTYNGLEMKLEILDVDANATDQCWMEITADGKKTQATLSEGQTQEIQANESIKLNLGNAGVVKVTVNGEDMGTLGQKGQVVKKTFQVEDFAATGQ